MSSELEATLERLRRARRPEDVFGDVARPAGHRIYIQLVRALHPDRHPDQKLAADEAMQLLNQWWTKFTQRGKPAAGPVEISSGRHRYTVTAALAAGEIADLYYAEDGRDCTVIVKIARDSANNDLMRNEQDALTKLAAADVGQWRVAYPELVGAFILGGRAVTILGKPEAELVSLVDVLEAYPRGIDARDMVWMWRRCLGAIGLAHRAGLVHGAVLPPHILLDLANHGAHLVGWTASAKAGGKIRVKSLDYTSFYPGEAPAASPGLDIAMLARTMLEATDQATLPIGLRRVLGICMAPIEGRARDALLLHDVLVRDAALACFGPPKFRPFIMPERATTA